MFTDKEFTTECKHSDADTIQMKHDYVTFSSCSEDINREYEKNKNSIISHLESVIKDVNLTGQWSIDIMQNSNDFYIIDMAQADNSAYYKETVPLNKRIKSEEDWIPKISI